MGTKLFLSVTSKRGKKICWEGEEKEDFNHRQNGHSFHLFVDDDDDNDDDDGNDDDGNIDSNDINEFSRFSDFLFCTQRIF